MTITNDLLGIGSDGTLQRFTLSTAAVEQAADLFVTEDEALAVANDPDSAGTLDRVPHLRAHVAGDLLAVVDTKSDLIVSLLRVQSVDADWAAAA